MLAHDRRDRDAFGYDERHGVDGDGDRSASVVSIGTHAGRGGCRCELGRSGNGGRRRCCAYACHCVVGLRIATHSRRSGKLS